MNFLVWIWVQLITIIIPSSDGIHNGEVADHNQFKYMAYVYTLFGESAGACGGIIIDKAYILTAAHCVEDVESSETFVFVGGTHLTYSLNAMWRVKDIYVHPNYESGEPISCTDFAMRFFLPCVFGLPEVSSLMKNDIAVLKLLEALPLGENITKVALPQTDSLPYCQDLEYAGWGEIEDSLLPMELQCTRIVIFDGEECERHVHCTKAINFASQLRIGDSGNPVVDENIVYGITSFSYPDTPQIPVIFTKVFTYKNFIENIMEDHGFY